MGARLRLATRSSPLALEQARRVARRLERNGWEVALVVTETAGDRQLDRAIGEISGTGVFVAEVELAVFDGRAEIAVHSAKDLPSSSLSGPAEGLLLAGVPERADPRDALVGGRLGDLGAGALVATGSARRRSQLAAVRPDLGFVELRGNIARRLDRIPEGGAVVVAAAALERLGLSDRAAEILPVSVMLPQVGQGAIALTCAAGDARSREALAAIDDVVAHRCVRAERAFLARLGGGCDAPVGAFALPVDPQGGRLRLEGMIASVDGHVVLRRFGEGDDPETVGGAVAEGLLEESGGQLVLVA